MHCAVGARVERLWASFADLSCKPFGWYGSRESCFTEIRSEIRLRTRSRNFPLRHPRDRIIVTRQVGLRSSGFFKAATGEAYFRVLRTGSKTGNWVRSRSDS